MNGEQVRMVQRGRLRTGAGLVLTGLACGVVLLGLTLPDRLAELGPGGFLRLPLEPIVFLAVVLALPERARWVRAVLAVLAGLALGLVAILRVLDLGFLQAFDRAFDPVIDWRYAGSLADLVHNTYGDRRGTVLLAMAVLGVLLVLVLMPLAALRIAHVACAHPAGARGVTAGLAVLWLALAATDLHGAGGTLASRDASAYAYHQVSRVPSVLSEQEDFARAALHDPLRVVPTDALLTGLRGKDVLVVFVESYGRVAVEGSSVSPGVTRVLDTGTRRLRADGFDSRSAFLTSPTFGGLSWLAHSTLQSGLWVDDQQRYDVLMSSPRLTLSRAFARAGWRVVADVPANTRDWPQGSFYGYDHVYDSRNVGYRGPRFGYPTIPDQYTLEAFHRLELANDRHRAVMAEVDLVSSHVPWAPTPRFVDPAELGDGSVYDGMPDSLPSQSDVWPSPTRVRAAYGQSIEYSLRCLISFVRRHGDDDLVLVVLGDHQPATIVSGTEASHDVPISVVARDPAVLQRISGWGWQPGLRPRADAPVWPMDAFRDRFLAAFGAAPADPGAD